ncbi:uncharacterized protein [Macrobrachium rosenbergii]|uniref:uncharacterized protein n=1 Tax=Macrobrachium rosenbergii TaxID=79674 RepID=UPI0034D70616
MFKKILIILAVTCVAICEVNVTHFVPNELQAVPTNKSELMFVLWNAFLANFIKLDWNTTFGYVANTSVEVAIIVRTNEAVQLGKWTVGRKRPVYSSYPNEEIIAHHPEDLGNGLYLFKLSIPQPGHTFYNNNVTFEAIINETHRTNHSFIIPFVFSMDGIVATSQALFCIFLLSIVLIVLKMATFLGYKYFLFVPLDWPLRLGILLSCVLTTVGFWYLLHKLVVFALGPSVVIVNVMNITIASLLCFSIIPPNLIHIPLGFIHIIQHWFKPICNLCIFYVTLITFTVFLTTTVNIFSINSCVAKEASVLFRGAKSFMSQGVEGVVQDMKHLFNEELRVNEDFELPKDDLFKSFVEMLGASGETPLDELKQLGRNYTKMQQDKCLGVFADLVNQCSDSKKTWSQIVKRSFMKPFVITQRELYHSPSGNLLVLKTCVK